MKLWFLISRLLLITLIVLLVSSGGLWWFSLQRSNTSRAEAAKSYPSATVFLPRQSLAVVSLLVNPDRLNPSPYWPLPYWPSPYWKIFSVTEEQAKLVEDFRQFKTSLLANIAPNYDLDIQPWLGNEVTLALTTLDLDRARHNGLEPGYLLALEVKDLERAQEFLHSFWQRTALAGADLMFENYQGIKLIYGRSAMTGAAGINLASASLNPSFILFANDPIVLRDAINNLQVPELNLMHNPAYQQAVEAIEQPYLSLGFLNLSQLLEAIYQRNATVSVSDLANLPPYMGLVLGLEPGTPEVIADVALAPSFMANFRFNSAVKSTPVSLRRKRSRGRIHGALRYIPSDISILITGTQLNQLWQQVVGIFERYGLSSQLATLIAKVEDIWEINLPEQIFAWVVGEYAIGFSGDEGEDWIFVVDRSTPQAQEGIAAVDTLAADLGYSVDSVVLENGQNLTAWTMLEAIGSQPSSLKLQTVVRGVHTPVDQYEVFGSSIPTILAALKPENTIPLAKNELFQEAIEALNRGRDQGFIYLNWGQSRLLLEQHLPLLKFVELAGQPLLSDVRSIILKPYGQTEGVEQGAIAIQLMDIKQN